MASSPPPTGPPTPAPVRTTTDDDDHSFLSPRSLRQFSIFCVGAGFMAASVVVTRRAIVRRRIASMPAFHHATVPFLPVANGAATATTTTTTTAAATTLASRTLSPSPPLSTTIMSSTATTTPTTTTASSSPKTNEDWRAEGSLLAVDALGLATLNVMAFAIALAGGLAWALDVSSVDDLRARARRRLHVQTGGAAVSDESVDREIEEWLAGVFARLGVVKGGGENKEGDGGGESGGEGER